MIRRRHGKIEKTKLLERMMSDKRRNEILREIQRRSVTDDTHSYNIAADWILRLERELSHIKSYGLPTSLYPPYDTQRITELEGENAALRKRIAASKEADRILYAELKPRIAELERVNEELNKALKWDSSSFAHSIHPDRPEARERAKWLADRGFISEQRIAENERLRVAFDKWMRISEGWTRWSGNYPMDCVHEMVDAINNNGDDNE